MGIVVQQENPLMRAKEVYLARYAPETRRTYESRLKVFMAWYQTNRSPEFIETLSHYLSYLRDVRKLAPRTIQNHLNAVKGMIKTAAILDKRFIEYLPQLDLVKAPAARGEVQGLRLTVEQARKLIDAPGIDTPKGIRDTSIFRLMLTLGLRRSEVCNLAWGHVTEISGHKVIANLRGKHGRVRTMKLKEDQYDLLQQWGKLTKRDMGNPSVRVYVPISRAGRILSERDGMTTHAIYALLMTYTQRTGLPPVKPHDLRRTAALLARLGGASIEQIQILLGHESPQTTSRYIGMGLDLDDHAVDYNPL